MERAALDTLFNGWADHHRLVIRRPRQLTDDERPLVARAVMPQTRRKIRAPGADTALMRDEGDRFFAWRLDDAPTTPEASLEDERMEHALLAYAQRSAAQVGAEWFAAEFARREEDERLQRERPGQRETVPELVPEPAPDVTLIDASVEDEVVGGAPTGLGLEPPPPEPTMRHPHVPRPPEPEAPSKSKRRRRRKQAEGATPSFAISAPEWARMSPGARRLYGLDASPPVAATG